MSESGNSGIEQAGIRKGFRERISKLFKEKQITEVDLARILENPGAFIDSGEIITSGFVQELGSRQVSWPITRTQHVGNVPIVSIDWLTQTVNSYLLHDSSDMGDVGLPTSMRDSNFTVGAPISPDQQQFDKNVRHRFKGEIENIKLEDGSESVTFNAKPL